MTVLSPKLPKEEASRAQAFEMAPCALLVVTPEGEIAFANSAAETLLGGALTARRAAKLGLLDPHSDIGGFIGRVLRRGGGARQKGLEIVLPGEASLSVDAEASVHPDGAATILLTPREETDADAPASALQTAANLGRTLAHEIKNPLAGIRGAAQLLQSGASPEDSALAQLIVDETDRVRRLVERLEAFSDVRRLHIEAVNIHRVLDRVRALVANGVGEGIRFRVLYDPSLPPARGDEDQLVQIFLNLVKNAAEAARSRRDDHGEVVISTAYRHLARPSDGEAVESAPLEVRVQDNGPGVAPEVRRRLFDPFVTAKPGGTGLGLTVAAQLVAAHKGVIDFHSEPGKTVFRVHLPILLNANPDEATV